MTKEELKKLEEPLKGQSYESVQKALEPLTTDDLLQLLDSKSTRVGDTAASLLGSRKETSALIGALRTNRLTTARGKIRATNILKWFGRAVPDALKAYLHLLDDRSAEVMGNALFGIVFWRRRDLLPVLQEHLARAGSDPERREIFSRAIEALEADNPSLFSPGFQDGNNVWQLDKPATE